MLIEFYLKEPLHGSDRNVYVMKYDGLIGCFPLKCGTTSYQRAFGARHRTMEMNYVTDYVYNLTTKPNKRPRHRFDDNLVESEQLKSPQIYGFMQRLAIHPRYFSPESKESYLYLSS